jgi:predicted GIY-YIG superfamily endonuclease
MGNENSNKPFIGEDGRYHYIYLITNNVNGKYYKGVHSTFDLNDNYLGSGTALEKAKEKYGKKNFSIEFIKFFKTRDEAIRGEFEYITEADIAS